MVRRQSEGTNDVEARWKEFWDDHKDFDSAWARNVLHMLSEFLPFVFAFDAVQYCMEQLYTRSINVPFPADWDWSRDWTDADEHLPTAILRQLPIFRLALALDAYAYYGLKLIENGLHDLDAFLEDLLSRAESAPSALWLFPSEWSSKEMEQTLTAAVARRKLDHGNAIASEELAALVKLPRKNIVNLIAPAKRGILKTDAQGLITVKSALLWLSARRDFRPSIWQQQSDLSIPEPNSEPLQNEDPVFVPVASDGTWFSPNDLNSRDNRYHVANGDHEEKYEDYWVALEFLSRSKLPRWGYYDATGRWRTKIGAGDDWLRKTRREINQMVQTSHAHETSSMQ